MTSGGTNDPNKLNHIFANPNHNLDALVQQFGSRRITGRAIFEAVDQGYRSGRLILDAFGRYEQLFDVEGYLVMVRGRIVNGLVRIETAWIPRHP